MKTLITLSALLFALTVQAVVPPVQPVTLGWDAVTTGGPGVVYRVYEITIISTNLLAMTTNNTATLTNVLAAPHRWTVTASNVWGESDHSIPAVVPSTTGTPSQPRIISTSLVVPIPGIVESTADLAAWKPSERTGVSADGVRLTWMVNATQPFEFRRAKGLVGVQPPMP